MTLPSSGALSLSQIAGEFGGSTPHSLSEYYGVASGVPSSGAISISQFYGKSSYSGTPTCNMWICGGGGGGGSTYGVSSNTAGGGGAGAQVWIGSPNHTIGGGDVFTVQVGSGGTRDNNGQDSFVRHEGKNVSYVGGRGGPGTGTRLAYRGGGAGSAAPTSPGAAVSGAIGKGGNGLLQGDAAGGGGGGALGLNNNINAYINPSSGNVTGGVGQNGTFLWDGVPTGIEMGKGGNGGGTKSTNLGGGNANLGIKASDGKGYGGGGGGGAYRPDRNYETEAGGAGSDGIVIIQYSNSYPAPSAVTGTYTAYNQSGYRTYVFTNDGTITW